MVDSIDNFRGYGFAIVAPEWAFNQVKETSQSVIDQDGSQKLLKKIFDLGFPMPTEKIPDYIRRTNLKPSLVIPFAA